MPCSGKSLSKCLRRSFCRFHSHRIIIDRNTVFLSALNTTGKENLEALSKAIMSFERPDMESAPQFTSYDAALDELTALSKEKRIVFVIDE